MSTEATPDAEALLAELVEAFQERRRKGEALSAESFAAAYPELQDELTS